MDVEIINPFVESVADIYQNMLGAQVKRRDPHITGNYIGPNRIVSLIGLSGAVTGSVAMSMPRVTAESIVGRLLGAVPDDSETLTDATCEVINMIVGGAKARFSSNGEADIKISLPTVIRGQDFKLSFPTKTRWLHIPFTSDLGDFDLRVTIESDTREAKKS